MLVLKCKREQSIVIGDDIEITIVSVGSKTVRFAIRAPPEIAVHRGEIYERIQAERARTASRPGA
ncbi:MAG: carbon storage regulator [bacterium]|jgi:carbon storage regulator